MPPRFTIQYRGEDFTVAERRELAIGAYVPWCVEVAGAWYQLTNHAVDVDDEVRRFFTYAMRSKYVIRTPSHLASRRYPLLLLVDGVAVRAWPDFVPRGTGAKTFLHPKLGHRVTTVKDELYWMFEATNRPPAPFGTKMSEQTLADVEDLAKLWLRTDDRGATE